MNPTSAIPSTQPQTTPDFGQYSDWAKQNMDKGVSADTLQQTLQSNNLNTAPSSSHDSFLQNMLPTIGSIALPTLGALLAPETGGLSLLASTALSGLGGAAGQGIKNATEGKDPFQSNMLTSGVEGATGGLTGGILSKLGGKVLTNYVAPAADKTATSLLAGQGRGALSNSDASYLYKNGVTNLKQMGDIAPVVTGSEGALSNAVTNSLYNAADNGTRIDLSSLASAAKGLPGQGVQKAIDAAGIGGDSTATNSIQKFITGQLRQYNPIKTIPSKGSAVSSFDNGVLNTQHPVDALNMSQAMDKTASTWLKSSSPTIQAQGKALQNISNTIKDGLYGPETAIGKSGITDQVKQQAIADLEPVKQINPQYYDAKVNDINNAQTIADLRSAQAPDVRASIANETSQNIANKSGGNTVPDLLKVGGPTVGMATGGPLGLAAGLIAPKVLGSEGAHVGATGVLSKLSDLIGNKSAGKLASTLTRAGAITASNLPNMGSEGGASQDLTGGLTPGDSTMSGQSGQSNPNSIASILQTMQSHPYVYGGQMGGVLSSLAPLLQKNQATQAEIGALQPSFEAAGGAQGVGGISSVLSGLIPGTAANTYQARSQALATQLAQSLGISPQAAAGLIPQLMQSPELAGQSSSVLNNLSGALGS